MAVVVLAAILVAIPSAACVRRPCEGNGLARCVSPTMYEECNPGADDSTSLNTYDCLDGQRCTPNGCVYAPVGAACTPYREDAPFGSSLLCGSGLRCVDSVCVAPTAEDIALCNGGPVIDIAIGPVELDLPLDDRSNDLATRLAADSCVSGAATVSRAGWFHVLGAFGETQVTVNDPDTVAVSAIGSGECDVLFGGFDVGCNASPVSVGDGTDPNDTFLVTLNAPSTKTSVHLVVARQP